MYVYGLPGEGGARCEGVARCEGLRQVSHCILITILSDPVSVRGCIRRSKSKPNWPGKLDHIVAGGQPYGISVMENVIKECEE